MKNKLGLLACILSAATIITVSTPFTGKAISNAQEKEKIKMHSSQLANDVAQNSTFVPVSSVTRLPDGGLTYYYKMNNGTDEYIVPPNGFDPVTATNDKLVEYGFGLRPTDPVELTNWKQTWSHYKRTSIPNIYVNKTNNEITYKSDKIDSNWSGYENYESNLDLDGVKGDYVQPSPLSVVNKTYFASWVGLGGDRTNFGVKSSGLLQAGTEIDADRNAPNVPFHCYAWTELVYFGDPIKTQDPVIDSANTIMPGNDIHDAVNYDTSTRKVEL